MAPDQTVVDHLLQGRQALHADVDRANSEVDRLHAELERLHGEIERLSAAIVQLDTVIGMIDSGATPAASARTAPSQRAQGTAETRPTRSGAPAKRTVPRSQKPSGQAPKSIRVHVLDMLAAENREWSLAEIIDRIHGAGIQAHDDAVRSITIKLMKDGRVERVGRGQYRLARRGSTRSTSPATPPPAADEAVTDEAVTDGAPVTESTDDTTYEPTADEADGSGDDPADDPSAPETVGTDESAAEPEPADHEHTESQDASYTPPLNLGQPWS